MPAGWVGMGHFLGFPDDLELQVSATPFQLFSLEAPSRASPGLSEQLGLTAEQVGLKAGMLVCSLFPILGIIVLLCTIRFFKKCKKAGVTL